MIIINDMNYVNRGYVFLKVLTLWPIVQLYRYYVLDKQSPL